MSSSDVDVNDAAGAAEGSRPARTNKMRFSVGSEWLLDRGSSVPKHVIQITSVGSDSFTAKYVTTTNASQFYGEFFARGNHGALSIRQWFSVSGYTALHIATGDVRGDAWEGEWVDVAGQSGHLSLTPK